MSKFHIILSVSHAFAFIIALISKALCLSIFHFIKSSILKLKSSMRVLINRIVRKI